MIKYYAAPLEGVTGFVWRKAHKEIFGCADKYFTPFLSPNQNFEFQTKELRDITQNENSLVPQILTGKAEHFIWAAKELRALGYEEINFNLGCPSGTVVTKNKGSGLLRDVKYLDSLLFDIYNALPDMKISIKTRVGFHDADSWFEILEVFGKYPVEELIVHPRVRDQQYGGLADRELFKKSLERSSLNLVYNGDVYTPGDEAFSFGCSVMCGRGLVSNPALFRQAQGGGAASNEELRTFHDLVLEGYKAYMPGDVPLIHRMKEFWHYFSASFNAPENVMKQFIKAKTIAEYNTAVNMMFE